MYAKEYWFAVKTAFAALGIIALMLGACVCFSLVVDSVMRVNQ